MSEGSNSEMAEFEWRIMERAAISQLALDIDEIEQLKSSAFVGYGGELAQREAFIERLRHMYPDREIPKIESGESLHSYMERTSNFFEKDKEK